MKSRHFFSLILIFLSILYPFYSFAESKQTVELLLAGSSDVNVDLPEGKSDEAMEHDFSIVSPDSNALMLEDAVTIATNFLLEQNQVIEKTANSPDRYNLLLLGAEDKAIDHIANYVQSTQKNPATYAWIVTFFITDTPFYIGTVTIASPAGKIIEANFGFIQQVAKI